MGRQRIGLLFKAQTPKAADQDYTLAQYRLALIFYLTTKTTPTTRQPLHADLLKAIEQTAKEQMQKLDDQDDDQDPPSEGGGSAGANVGPYAKTNRQFRSTTDPDVTLVRQGGLKSRLRYKTHRMVDDAHEIITAVETTTGAVYRCLQASLQVPLNILASIFSLIRTGPHLAIKRLSLGNSPLTFNIEKWDLNPSLGSVEPRLNTRPAAHNIDPSGRAMRMTLLNSRHRTQRAILKVRCDPFS